MATQYAQMPMSTADDIYNEVKTLPEAEARVVLDFVARLKTLRSIRTEAQRNAALATLKRYRGRFSVVKTQRDELHDRTSLR